MKKYWMGYLFSIILCAAGILCRDWLNVLDKALVLLGAALFLFTFVRHGISKAQRCPNCNAIINSGHIRTIIRQKDGIIPCEKCGSLICVNHSKRN